MENSASRAKEPMEMTAEEITALRQFHAERQQRQITVTCGKCSVPMLWLDTSIFIDLAKVGAGEIPQDNARHQILTNLKHLIATKVEEGKLVCPESEQELEIEGRRLEGEIKNIMTSLSSGVRCIKNIGVKDYLMQVGIKAYLEIADSVHVEGGSFFRDDPAETVKQAHARGFIIKPTFHKPDEWLKRAGDNRHTIKAKFEEMRQENTAAGDSFRQHLERERVGESDSMLQMLATFYEKVSNGAADIWDVMGVQGYFALHRYWELIGGPGPGETALFPYMRSAYYYELPPIDIASRLYADLMANKQPIKSGDNQDVQHLAYAIPVAHFVVTDKGMADRCRRLDIGRKWSTRIFSSSTLDELLEELAAL
jgi:hypothetical protein